jgi:hypothetical protein
MTILAIDEFEARALLKHTALCVTLAGALGLIAAGLTGVDPLSKIVHAAVAFVCMAGCFAILWCTADGPDRWRPFIISHETAEGIFGGAAGVIVLEGIAAATGLWVG